jgi:hypothetical protein
MELSPSQLSDLFYDLVTDLLDCSSSEYLSFVSSPLLLELLQTKLLSASQEDH